MHAAAGSPRALHEIGLGNLLSHRFDEAVDRLRDAAKASPHDGDYWSDLAGALIARAKYDDDAGELPEALAAADHALEANPRFSAALFNRALALERLHLDAAARKAYGAVLLNEADDRRWADEAMQRATRLQHASRAALWSQNRRQLGAAVRAGDTAAVDRIVGAFRQETRTSGELEVMGDWASETLRGDAAAATAALSIARAVGESQIRQHGDPLLADAARCAAEAAADARRATTLAEGYRAYYDGRRAYAQREVARSAPLLETAIDRFARARSPMRDVAAYYLASAHFDSNDGARAERELFALVAEVPSKYVALHAQLAWELGTVASSRGFIYSELRWYSEALEAFATLSEHDNATTMRGYVASVLGELGRDTESWHERQEAFASASATGDASKLQPVLAAAAVDALNAQRWKTARALLTVAVATPNPNARLRSFQLVERAIATWRCGGDATADLTAAAAAANEIGDRALREATIADLTIKRAAISAEKDPQNAFAWAGESIQFAEAHNRTVDLPFALLQRARAARALHRDDDAIADLKRAIDVVEQRRASIAEENARDSFLATKDEIYNQLTDMLDERGDVAQAFETAERLRARMLAERRPAGRGTIIERPFEAAIRGSLQPSVPVVEYLSLPQRLIVFVVTPAAVNAFHVAVRREELAVLGKQLVDGLRSGDTAAAQTAGAALHSVLLKPLTSSISTAAGVVIVADDVTAALPFAALYDAAAQQYFVERTPLMYAPSATSFALGSRDVDPKPAHFNALIVGDPSIPADTASRLASLPQLPAARLEAADVAGVYGSRPVVGREATRARVLTEAPQSDVLHFATHALACRFDPSQSALVLAGGESSDGTLTVRAIASMNLARRPVVMLAGCKTAAAAERGGTLRNLAAAFIAAGSRDVIGTEWDVEDTAARELSVRFHREVARGARPAEALRNAQLAMLRSNPRSLATWSSFKVSGVSF